MSIEVGEDFTYLCIPELTYQQPLWVEALKLLQRLHK
jgi:hypothetical protein